MSVAERLARLDERIVEACRRSSRPRDDVTLVAVSKRHPLVKIEQAIAAGQRRFGENQVQEAQAKQEQAVEQQIDGGGTIEWHLIGPLQSNKVKIAARIFHVLHSVDRGKIARLLDREAEQLGRRLDVFAQINIGGESSKHGFSPGDFEQQIRPLAEFRNLRWLGLMAIPPYEPEAELSRRWFRKLRELRDAMLTWPEWDDCPGRLSMGMSHDLEIAIEEGATHVRVGTDIFGKRPS